jgi:hypothetical protein
LLPLVSRVTKVNVQQPWNELLANNGQYRRHPYPIFPAWLLSDSGGIHDLGRYFGLVDRWNGLDHIRHSILHPVELSRIHRGHLNGRNLYVAFVVMQLTAK